VRPEHAASFCVTVTPSGASPTPTVNVGDGFAAVTAIVDYAFGNFKFDITSPVTAINNGLTAESTALLGGPAH
jgi:hypothetical protein